MTEEKTVTDDVGELILTNKKLSFIGERKSVTTRFSAIHDVIYYDDGIEVQRSNGKHLTFICDLDTAEQTLMSRALSE